MSQEKKVFNVSFINAFNFFCSALKTAQAKLKQATTAQQEVSICLTLTYSVIYDLEKHN